MLNRRLIRWSEYVRRESMAFIKAGPDNIFTLDLVISDENKPLLLNNPAFVPYLCVAIFSVHIDDQSQSSPSTSMINRNAEELLSSADTQWLCLISVDALLLDPDHKSADLPEPQKVWIQTHHMECLCQLAVFEPARKSSSSRPDGRTSTASNGGGGTERRGSRAG